jgi:hypothetical protein
LCYPKAHAITRFTDFRGAKIGTPNQRTSFQHRSKRRRVLWVAAQAFVKTLSVGQPLDAIFESVK